MSLYFHSILSQTSLFGAHLHISAFTGLRPGRAFGSARRGLVDEAVAGANVTQVGAPTALAGVDEFGTTNGVEITAVTTGTQTEPTFVEFNRARAEMRSVFGND